ncbi:alpha-glucosidase-like isoform X2 [Lingula anatina]|uniref:Alpha-glucosidase-like isoform X2 n=1 Tax=Lingula anatina TaxID=7574 RepID=A0A1S3KH98_LINAN|nr:alpha-glucosidase-like isoform X2 [Lingula anatina]|eukprot:XP_013421849.1 alpha-glucosidase-like isoform X2 [Lingula anatina]
MFNKFYLSHMQAKHKKYAGPVGISIILGLLSFMPRLLIVTFLSKTPEPPLEWWQTSVIYQVYPRSFQDSNGDGVGDLQGIRSRLDHLEYINARALWLSPMYESPMRDFGYDPSNITNIDPIFGTMEDFDELLADVHSRGMKMILDFIPNHTSDLHKWFQASKAGVEEYKDYYVWTDGNLTANGTRVPPNNWKSFFGDSAWEWVEERQQFYLHQFLKEQPDLNYRNPKVVEEMTNALRFWLERGVDGFRIDAVLTMFESADLSLNEPLNNRPGAELWQYESLEHIYTSHQPETYEVIAKWRHLADEYYQKDGNYRFLVTEAYCETIQQAMYYYHTGADMPFNFDLVFLNRTCGGDCVDRAISNWMTNMPIGKWPNWVIGNHDNKRIATKMGTEFVNAMNTLLLLLPGTPTTYNGEELGLTNIEVSYEDTQDPFGKRFGPERYHEVSRDPPRSPMLWDSTHSSGFSNATKTWLPVHPDYEIFNAEAQRKAEGVTPLKMYRDLSLLRQEATFQRGTFKPLLVDENIYSFVRELEGESLYYVILNFGSTEAQVDLAEQGLPENGLVKLNSGDFHHSDYNVGKEIKLNKISLNPGQFLVIKYDV